MQSRRDLSSQPFPTGAKKAWEGSGRLGTGEKTHGCLLRTGNPCCLPGFNGPQPPPSCIPQHQQIMGWVYARGTPGVANGVVLLQFI